MGGEGVGRNAWSTADGPWRRPDPQSQPPGSRLKPLPPVGAALAATGGGAYSVPSEMPTSPPSLPVGSPAGLAPPRPAMLR